MTVMNLDQKAAHYAQEMVFKAKQDTNVGKPVETLERLVTKTIGVLQEQGLYAMALFLNSRTGDEAKVAPVIQTQLFHLLQNKNQNHQIPAFADIKVPSDGVSPETALAFYADHILGNLELLFLVRDLYEQTLIYARYGAKAEG